GSGSPGRRRGDGCARTCSQTFNTAAARSSRIAGMNSRTDHNIWTGLSYDDPLAARAWLSALGFTEGILVMSEDGTTVAHSEMFWPEGGRVMLSSRGGEDDTFTVPRG